MTDDSSGPVADGEPGKHWSCTACGVVTTAGILVAGVWFVHGMLTHVRHKACLSVCVSNVHSISLAMGAYAADYDGRWPLAHNWCDQVYRHAYSGLGGGNRDWYECPAAPGHQCGYALNASLAGARAETVTRPEDTVLVYEALPAWNHSGGCEDVVFRHDAHDTACFVRADGQYQAMSIETARRLKWEP